MKASELMIGDWVGYLPTWKNEDGSIGRDGDPNNPIPFKVEMICWDCVDLDDREGGSFDADDISLYPIPLTTEILEKNEFKKDIEVYKWTIQKENIEIDLYAHSQFIGYKLSVYEKEDRLVHIDVYYVHELQHALRLCGIEKEIEL